MANNNTGLYGAGTDPVGNDRDPLVVQNLRVINSAAIGNTLAVTNSVTANTFIGNGAVPVGGTTNQVLIKVGDNDYQIGWGNASATYTLPVASDQVLGGVKVGANLSINSATGVLSGIGGGSSYTLPIASDQVLGGVRVGANLSINASTGVLSGIGGGSSYTLPIASDQVLGGVKVGANLSINSVTGQLSALPSSSYTLPVATANTIGGVQANPGATGQFISGVNLANGSLIYGIPTGGGGGYNLISQYQLKFIQGNTPVGTITSSAPVAAGGRIINSLWTGVPIPYQFDNSANLVQTQRIKLLDTTIAPQYGTVILPNTPFNTDWNGDLFINTNYAGNTFYARVTMNTKHFPDTAQEISTKRQSFPIAIRSGQLEVNLANFSSSTQLPPNLMTSDGSYSAAIPIRLELTVEYFTTGDPAAFNNTTNLFINYPTAISGNTSTDFSLFSGSVLFSQLTKATASGTGAGVQSVTTGFGLTNTGTAVNPVLRTSPATNNYSTNRAGLDSITLDSGLYRTLADTNNPANPGFEDWAVQVIEGDTGQGSIQMWYRLTSTPKIFVRSVDTNATYGSFVELTNQTTTLPIASATTLGGIKVGTNLSINSSTGVLSATASSSLTFSQRNPRQLYTTSEVNSGFTSVTFGVDVTGLYTPGYKFAFLSRPTSTIFTVVSSTFTGGVSTVTFSPAANDTYPINTQMWEIAQNIPTILAEGDGIEFDEEGTLTVISLNPATATTLGGISTGSPITGQFVQGVNANGSLKYGTVPLGQTPIDVASWTNASGVEYIANQSVAQQSITVVVESLPVSVLRVNSLTIPGFADGSEVVLTDATGRVISGKYTAAASTGLGYSEIQTLNQDRNYLFAATGSYPMQIRQGILATSALYMSGGSANASIASTKVSQITMGSNLTATIDPNNPNGLLLNTLVPVATANAVGGISTGVNAGGQFVSGVDASGALTYGTPASGGGGGSRGVVAFDISGQSASAAASDEIINLSFTGNYAPLLNIDTWIQTNQTTGSFRSLLSTGVNNTILAVSIAGIYKSTDNGQNWSQTNQTSGNFTALISTGVSNTLLAAGYGNGIYKSTDNGQNWSQTNQTSGDFTALISTGVSNTLLAATYGSGGIYKSTDNGQNWTQTNQTAGYFQALLATGSTILAASSSGNTGIWKSTDNGQNWTQTNQNTGQFNTFLATGVSNTLLAGGSGTGIWKSTDNGQNWTQTNQTSRSFYGFFSTGVNNTMLAGGSGGIYKSTDNGQTWTQNNQITGQFNTFFATGSTILAGSEAGIYKAAGTTSLSITLPAHNTYTAQTLSINNLTTTDTATTVAGKIRTAVAAARPTYTITTSGTNPVVLSIDTNSSGNITDTTFIQNGASTGSITLSITQGVTATIPVIAIVDPRDSSSFQYSPTSGATANQICNGISFGETLPGYWFSVSAEDTTKTRLLLESTTFGDLSTTLPTMTITNPGTLVANRSLVVAGSGSGGSSGGGGGSYVLPVASQTAIGGVKANKGTTGQFVTGINPADGSLTFDTPAGGGANVIYQGTYSYGSDITAVNASGKFTLGGNGSTAAEMSAQSTVSTPIAVSTTVSQTNLQVGAHILTNTNAIVQNTTVNFVDNLTNPTANILSATAQTIFGAASAIGVSFNSSDVDEDGALWIMGEVTSSNFRLARISFSGNYTTAPTYISSNNISVSAPSGTLLADINQFGITKVSTGQYRIVFSGSSSVSSDAARVYTANVTLVGSTLTVGAVTTLGPVLSTSVWSVKTSNSYGTYAASLSGGQIWKYNGSAWVQLYNLSPTDQSSAMVIDRTNGMVWVAYDTDAVVRIDQNNNPTLFPKSPLLSYTNVDEGQNTWGLIPKNNGKSAQIITYATLTSTGVNANYLITVGQSSILKVVDDLQLTNQIIDASGAQGSLGQVLTVATNNLPVWSAVVTPTVQFNLSADQTTGTNQKIQFNNQQFILGTQFLTNSTGTFTFITGGTYQVSVEFNCNTGSGTVDAWGTVNTGTRRYGQISGNEAKGVALFFLQVNANDTFFYKDNNNLTWYGGDVGARITFVKLQ